MIKSSQSTIYIALMDGADDSSQATELTLEDKITERLKAYQRQLAQVTEHGEV